MSSTNLNNFNKQPYFENDATTRRVRLPATVFTRTPLKERVHTFNQTYQSQVRKFNYTPLKQFPIPTSPNKRRNLNLKGNVYQSVMVNNNNSHNKCQNHPDINATFYVCAKEEKLFYCQKCTIMLASQGFNIYRILPTQKNQQENRINAVKLFLSNLQNFIPKFQQNLSWIEKSTENLRYDEKMQVSKVQRYYDEIIQLIISLKKSGISQVQSEYLSKVKQLNHLHNQISKSIAQCKMIKQDINQSLTTVIPQAEESEYRCVMNLYNSKLQKFIDLSKNIPHYTKKMKILSFEDPAKLITMFKENFSLKWQFYNSPHCPSTNHQYQENKSIFNLPI